MAKEIDIAFYYEVHNEIQSLKWYFYKFAGVNAEEAMQRTLCHTLSHFNTAKGSLPVYIKKLAREITKENSPLVFVDFLEQTLSDSDEEDESQAIGGIDDFSTSLVNTIDYDKDKRVDVVNLALSFMDKFLILCDALMKHDISTRYYPEIFIKNCLDISNNCPNFNSLCLSLYMEYKDDFEWFLQRQSDSDTWKEPDFALVANSVSKRIKLINPKTNKVVEDADVDSYELYGSIGSKKVIRVNYSDLWEYFCDLIDDVETNELKFIIGNSYICKTFGGSLSVLNPDLYNMYDIVRTEIVTNILLDTSGRILNIGSKCLYLLCNSNMNLDCLIRTAHGQEIKLVYEDITDSINTYKKEK